METQSLKSQPGEDKRWRKSKRDKVRREKMKVHVKVGKARCIVCFPMSCGCGGSKSNLAHAAGAEPAGERRDERVVARSTFRS